MWYVIRVGDSERHIVAWERDAKSGMVCCTMGNGDAMTLSLDHRTASRLCSGMNAEIKANAS